MTRGEGGLLMAEAALAAAILGASVLAALQAISTANARAAEAGRLEAMARCAEAMMTDPAPAAGPDDPCGDVSEEAHREILAWLG